MGDVIKFERPKESAPYVGFDGDHVLELHVYQHPEDRLSGVCSSSFHEYSSAEGRIQIAAILERMAWLVRKECAAMDERCGDLLAVAHVHAEGVVRVRVDDDCIQTDEQFIWLDGMLEDAKKAARLPLPSK